MNIWFLSELPEESAEILMSKSPRRANKYLIEFLQATAYLCKKHCLPLPLKKDGTEFKTALASRFPKPLLKWLEESKYNYSWAFFMAIAIDKKERIFNSLDDEGNYWKAFDLLSSLPKRLQTPFINYAKSKAKGLDFTHVKDTCDAYNQYLNAQL